MGLMSGGESNLQKKQEGSNKAEGKVFGGEIWNLENFEAKRLRGNSGFLEKT